MNIKEIVEGSCEGHDATKSSKAVYVEMNKEDKSSKE